MDKLWAKERPPPAPIPSPYPLEVLSGLSVKNPPIAKGNLGILLCAHSSSRSSIPGREKSCSVQEGPKLSWLFSLRVNSEKISNYVCSSEVIILTTHHRGYPCSKISFSIQRRQKLDHGQEGDQAEFQAAARHTTEGRTARTRLSGSMHTICAHPLPKCIARLRQLSFKSR